MATTPDRANLTQDCSIGNQVERGGQPIPETGTEALLSRHAWLVLLALLAGVFACSWIGSQHKPLWFDEMFTLIVATQPTLHRFAQAMPAEGNPPLNTLLARFSMQLFGVHPYALRLPAMLGFSAALALLWVLVRRERNNVAGLLAVVLVICQPVWKYSFEARPYGVLLACVMLALVSWQTCARSLERNPHAGRGLPLFGMALGIVGAIFSHYLGVLNVLIPLAFGEGCRTYKRRSLDRPVLAVGGTAFLSVAYLVPMMRRTRQLAIDGSSWTPRLIFSHFGSYLRGIQSSWDLVFSTGLLALIIAALWLTWNRSGPKSPESRSPSDYALAAALGAALLIPFAWLAMLSAKGYFFCRYGIASALGVAILAAFLMARHHPASRSLLILSLLFFGFFGLKSIQRDLSGAGLTPAIQYRSLYEDPTGSPIVIADPLLFPTVWWYSPHPMRQRIVYLADIAEHHATAGRNLLDSDLVAERNFVSAPILGAASFLRSQPSFLLFDTTPDLFLKNDLASTGCTVELAHDGQNDSLYQVHCPPSATPQSPSAQ